LLPFHQVQKDHPTKVQKTFCLSKSKMSFVFHGSSPSPQIALGDEDVSVHHTAPSPIIPPVEHDMGRDKERPRLEILLDKESIYLKGTGVDVEPARLSGHVALYLAESTSIKEITLQFRGKARLLAPTHDSYVFMPLTSLCRDVIIFVPGCLSTRILSHTSSATMNGRFLKVKRNTLIP